MLKLFRHYKKEWRTFIMSKQHKQFVNWMELYFSSHSRPVPAWFKDRKTQEQIYQEWLQLPDIAKAPIESLILRYKEKADAR